MHRLHSVKGRDVGQLFCLEVFCGTAGITAELRAKGMKASLGIDHIRCKGGRAPILRLDLTKETDQHRLLDLLEIPELVFVWIALPLVFHGQRSSICPGWKQQTSCIV
ncbi:unnamed protein product [Effrenium voratum]|uniref:Uncharacterized protein n=1 Tax=Effrenium voratum TaxID=2562239 RepID=A0AA36JH31_9DINO|nr:unnamed protein product [Effrenium voratum]